MSKESKIFFHFTTSLCLEVVPLFAKAIESVFIAFGVDDEIAEEAAQASAMGYKSALKGIENQDVTSFECRLDKTDDGCLMYIGSVHSIDLDLFQNALSGCDIWKKWLADKAPEKNSEGMTFYLNLQDG